MARRFSLGASSSSSSSSRVQAMDDDDETVYVAVSNEVEESKPTLLWALQSFGRVCILHVHQPSKGNPFNKFQENQLRVNQEYEIEKMKKILEDYRQICYKARVPAEKLHIEMDDVGEGIVALIYEHGIKKLVMGGAANKHYSEGMTYLKSKKAIYVCQHLPPYCQIWFICNGHRIHTREGDFDVEATSPSSVVETGPSNPNSPFLDSTVISSERTEEETIDQLISQLDSLEEAILEAEKSKREVHEEYVKRVKAEKTAIEALRRATEELRCRREIEEALAKQKEDLKDMRKQWNEECVTTMDQILLLENQVASYGHEMKELSDKAEICKKERDDLQIELDKAVKLTVESSHMNQFFSEFSVKDISDATRDFHQSLKIGEGGHGRIFQGSLHKTEVAIKLVHQTGFQVPLQFEHQVNVLSKLRHPNLVTLIGVCPENWSLIYEYLPNGNLEDRLSCRNNTPPLSLQTRICIATDLCAVLIFLHSQKPCVVHGNLKPSNILLDANFACKLNDFGSALSLRENSTHGTDTSPYLDPEFLRTGELSPKSDIYSFGMILVQLITGLSPLNIVNGMQNSLDTDNLITLLDTSAGDWPDVDTRGLLHWVVNCCGNRSRQPDLSDVWAHLKRMRDSCEAPSSSQPASDSCEAPSSSQPASEDDSEAPPYFNCPISQDVMEEPHFAADGFTYELEAIRTWLDGGHNTSPSTNLRLPHGNLVPNYALRSAIQEWQQRHSNVQM